MIQRKIILIACGAVVAIGIGGIGLLGKNVLDNQVFASTCAAKQVAIPDNPRQVAESITVKVFSGNGGGSGTLIAKQGQVYTVLTNQHVLTSGEPYRIQTPDGRIYSAEIPKNVNFGKNDLALLQFRADADYTVAVLAETGFQGNLAVNQEVFAAGFPFDGEKLTFNSGKISLLPDKTLQGGYRIGYTNDIQKGMSGGPILNSQGEVIGINGVHAYALFGDPYVFEDGSKPSDTQKEQMTRLSWGVPIQPPSQLAAANFLKNVERTAQEITVLITYTNGNGSGVIIAQRDNTYYVLTANHVVRDERQYEVTTPDGRCYPVNYRTVKKFEGVDLAVLEFKSDRSYRVATLGKYDLGKEDSFVFVSGWAASRQSGKGKPSRLFTSGNLFNQESASLLTKDSSSFTKGYEMLYTNITAGGVSGGAVLDTRGRLIGIHAAAEGEVTLDEAGQERPIQLGYSLGVPVSNFLSLATKLGIEPGWLKIETSLPLPLTEIEKISIFESLLPTEISEDSTDALVWLNYGNQLWRLERYKKAVEAFSNAIQYKKGFYQALYARGWAQIRQKQFQEALESFAEATKLEPKFAPAWRWRGFILYNLGRDREAIECFDKTLALDSNYSDIRLWRGDVLLKSQRYSEAIDDFTQVIRLNSTDLCVSCAYQSRGNANFQLEKYQAAIDDFTEAIRRKPDHAYAYLRRGDAHFIQKKYQEAIANYTEVIRLKPDAAEVYYLRGSAHALQEDYKTAIADFTEAIRLKPDYADAYYYRGISRNKKKDYKEAIADFTEAIHHQPYNDDAYLNRAVALDALGYKSRALEDAKKGLLLRLRRS